MAQTAHGDAFWRLNLMFSKAIENFSRVRAPAGDGEVAWSQFQAEAAAEEQVDLITEQIRALKARTMEDLAVKLRAMFWDAGLLDRLDDTGDESFETGAMRALLAEAEAVIPSRAW